MALTGFEFDFPFQVDVAAGKQPKFYVLIDGTDGKPKLRMFHNNLVRGMPLPDQRGNHLINMVEFLSGEMEAGSGIPECFPVPAVCKERIIMVLMGDGTACMSLITTIANIRSLVKPAAVLPYKILAVLVARRAGSTFDITKDNLSTDIFLLAMETVDTKVFGIQEESSSRVKIRQAVCTDLLGYRAWVFAEMACNLFE